jgi:hypothetical protein
MSYEKLQTIPLVREGSLHWQTHIWHQNGLTDRRSQCDFHFDRISVWLGLDIKLTEISKAADSIASCPQKHISIRE